MGVVHEKWKSTSMLVAPVLRRDFEVYMAGKGLSYTKVMNAVMLALLNGDISIDEIPYGEQRVVVNTYTTLADQINISIRDKAGNLLNPTKTYKEEE